jgi:segregation and condensation protein A
MSTGKRSIVNRDSAFGASYLVSQSAYDGPLDLLLHLIERRELEISEVSLCTVTEQYLHTLQQLDEIDPGALADFLSVASRLLLIKSNRLLPKPLGDEEEEEDTGDALVRQLIEYRQFRHVAENLKTRVETACRVHVRPALRPITDHRQPHPPDLTDVDAESLQSVLRSVLQRIPVVPPPLHVLPYKVTVSEQIDRIRVIVQQAQESVSDPGGTRLLFSSVLSSAYTRTEVIVTFLAILELIKQEELAVEQESTFGEIYLIPLKLGDGITE